MTDDGPPEHDADATALVVLVPEAEALVGTLRAAMDPSAADGMPAHVTVLYPFAPAARLSEHDVRHLGAVIGRVAAFDVRFRRTRRFRDAVLWLAPEPAAPFAQLTTTIEAAFPEWPPYGGAYDEPMPHLTVADARGEVDVAAAALPKYFDVGTRVAEVAWMELTDGRWRARQVFPLRS